MLNKVPGLLVAAIFFSSGALAQEAKLTLSPALVVTGATDRLAIESDGSFDLSKVTAREIIVSPDHDVRGIKVLDTGPKSVGIALDLSNNAQLGKRTISVRQGDRTAAATLEVIQGAALVVEAPGSKSGNKAVTTTINVTSRAGLDLSKVKATDVKVAPADFGVVEITNQTSDGLTLGLKAPASKKNAAGTLRIGGDINLAADFSLAVSHAPKACGKLQQCCGNQAAGKCTSCLPLDQVCRKPGS
jgi:hypothetical protein